MASRRLVRFELLVRLVDVLSFSLNQAVPPLSFQSSTAANASDEPPPSENGTIKLEAIALEAESSGMRRRPPAGRAQRDSNACARTTRTATLTPARATEFAAPAAMAMPPVTSAELCSSPLDDCLTLYTLLDLLPSSLHLGITFAYLVLVIQLF